MWRRSVHDWRNHLPLQQQVFSSCNTIEWLYYREVDCRKRYIQEGNSTWAKQHGLIRTHHSFHRNRVGSAKETHRQYSRIEDLAMFTKPLEWWWQKAKEFFLHLIWCIVLRGFSERSDLPETWPRSFCVWQFFSSQYLMSPEERLTTNSKLQGMSK